MMNQMEKPPSETPPESQPDAPSEATADTPSVPDRSVYRWRRPVNWLNGVLVAVAFLVPTPSMALYAGSRLILLPLVFAMVFGAWEHRKLCSERAPASTAQWRDQRLVLVGQNITMGSVLYFMFFTISSWGHPAVARWSLLVLVTLAIGQLVKIPAEDRLRATGDEALVP
jgi:hypothetical protein